MSRNLIYNGNVYRTYRAVSQAADVSETKLRYYIHKGLAPDEAVQKIKSPRYQYNGRAYFSRRAIAEDMGVSLRILMQNQNYANFRDKVLIKEGAYSFAYRGVSYANKQALYDALGVTSSAVRKYALRHNKTREEALDYYADKTFGVGRGCHES